MTHFSACTGCAVDTTQCASLRTIKGAIRGLGITTVRHRCGVRVPRYEPGCAVWIKTFDSRESGDEDGPRVSWFPGVFISQKGSRAIAFIKPGALDELSDEDYPFQPENRGFVKVPLSRVKDRDGVPVSVVPCLTCGDVPALSGCGHPQRYPGDVLHGCLQKETEEADG